METIELTPKQDKIADAIGYLGTGFVLGAVFMFLTTLYLEVRESKSRPRNVLS